MQDPRATGGVSRLTAALLFSLAHPAVAPVLLGNLEAAGLHQNLKAAQQVVDPRLFVQTGRFALGAAR